MVGKLNGDVDGGGQKKSGKADVPVVSGTALFPFVGGLGVFVMQAALYLDVVRSCKFSLQ